MNLKRIRLWLLSLLTLLGLIASVGLSHFTHAYPSTALSQSAPLEAQTAEQYDQLGRDRFSLSQFRDAVEAWQQALMQYEKEGNVLAQAQVLSNLSLTWQQLGQWHDAERAITDSLALLNRVHANSSPQALGILAQVLNTQGSLKFSLGHMNEALTHWEQAADRYAQADDDTGKLRSQINQVQAMQELGLHRLAIKQLQTLNDICHQTYPASPLQADVLRRLGDALRLTGHVEQSQQVLTEGVAIAQKHHLSGNLANLFFSLGKTASVQMDHAVAQDFYTQALSNAPSMLLKTQIELAQLQGFIVTQQWASALELWPDIQVNLSQLPHHRESIYAQISLATQLVAFLQEQDKIQEPIIYDTTVPNWEDVTQVLEVALQGSHEIGDRRSETYAVGYLGTAYEHTQAWSQAEVLTRRALLIAQNLDAADISYRWQWQLGRILKVEGKTQEAIAAYSEATDLLTHLRGDLIATSSEEQFRFREQVEPVYREFVSLLIPSHPFTPIQQSDLVKARDVIESLRLAELDNFFKEACLDDQAFQIDQVDQSAAVLYPIILGDRLEVILSLPNQPLSHYTTAISEEKLTDLADDFRKNLVIRSRFNFQEQAEQFYDWLIRPAIADLQEHHIETLVFVLDGPLRSLPMAALSDGSHYLLESYRLAVAPGLQLIDPQPLPRGELKALAAGLTQARQGFSPLEHVELELQKIESEVPSVVLLDQTFTSDSLQNEIEQSTFPVVHIATHGQFGSSPESTFVLTWSDRLNITNLEKILETGFPNRQTAVELLILSACETATGDQRAPLGLAGVAVRAGARSTVATLWSVNDAATAQFMGKFYQELNNSTITKAEALRKAQLWLLKQSRYNHPIYWAPYLLVGNWL